MTHNNEGLRVLPEKDAPRLRCRQSGEGTRTHRDSSGEGSSWRGWRRDRTRGVQMWRLRTSVSRVRASVSVSVSMCPLLLVLQSQARMLQRPICFPFRFLRFPFQRCVFNIAPYPDYRRYFATHAARCTGLLPEENSSQLRRRKAEDSPGTGVEARFLQVW